MDGMSNGQPAGGGLEKERVAVAVQQQQQQQAQAQMQAQQGRHAHVTRTYMGAVIMSYASASLGGVFVNKACLSGFNFQFPITIVFLQLLVSVAVMSLLRLFRLIEIPKRTTKQIAFLLYPAVFFVANVSVGLTALGLVNIPMFSAFRRLTVLNVMVMEWYVLKKQSSMAIKYCVLFMVFGSIVAAYGDITFDPLGYFLVFLNNLLTAGNLVSIKKATQVVQLDAMAMFYYVSLVSLPIVLALGLATGELARAYLDFSSRPELHGPGFAFALVLSASSAFAINYTTNLCTQVTSALITCITGQTKNVLQTLIGIFSWGYEASPLNLLGLFLALVASCFFATVKYREGREKEKDPSSLPAGEKSSALEELDERIPTAEEVRQQYARSFLFCTGSQHLAATTGLPTYLGAVFAFTLLPLILPVQFHCARDFLPRAKTPTDERSYVVRVDQMRQEIEQDKQLAIAVIVKPRGDGNQIINVHERAGLRRIIDQHEMP
ncbi:UDP-N-acetylglucosamine/UDP-glucose/GDP-mannose transporter [Porphyridium purpureum]|uniref:UDP-N-acetylglucosamine/UDP-glucose/GDP-mannose transporter n=1 Tax=Porphyridium purpureum TaxID=35688 RepID=A0A5J4YYV4_PORPP|nr:UDP-N-acetylglucosamine/UDP-glucose/GDP-mannose transporter [Porphyridium purpureum]|eukprot:POR2326..scf209_3